MPKKDEKVRMCVDYRDLKRSNPKDNYSLPHIDTLVNNTATNRFFSFMDGFSSYNQIKMAKEGKARQHLPLIGKLMHMMSCHSA